MQDYKERLRAFNSTEKYSSEASFLSSLLDREDPYLYRDATLDYGCGTGQTAYQLYADGYDVNNYNDKDINLYIEVLPKKDYKDIYFMHSLAHIPNPIEVLKDLKERYDATITVITPNASWLNIVGDTKSDPTVIKHYTQDELKELFESAGYKISLIGQFGEERNGINERIFLQAK